MCVHVAKLATRSAVNTFWARSYKLWWKSSLASIAFRFFAYGPYGATINNNGHTTQRFAAQRCHDECRRQQFNQLHWGTVMSCSWCVESFAPAKIGSQLLVSLANHPTLKNSWDVARHSEIYLAMALPWHGAMVTLPKEFQDHDISGYDRMQTMQRSAQVTDWYRLWTCMEKELVTISPAAGPKPKLARLGARIETQGHGRSCHSHRSYGFLCRFEGSCHKFYARCHPACTSWPRRKMLCSIVVCNAAKFHLDNLATGSVKPQLTFWKRLSLQHQSRKTARFIMIDVIQ